MITLKARFLISHQLVLVDLSDTSHITWFDCPLPPLLPARGPSLLLSSIFELLFLPLVFWVLARTSSALIDKTFEDRDIAYYPSIPCSAWYIVDTNHVLAGGIFEWNDSWKVNRRVGGLLAPHPKIAWASLIKYMEIIFVLVNTRCRKYINKNLYSCVLFPLQESLYISQTTCILFITGPSHSEWEVILMMNNTLGYKLI